MKYNGMKCPVCGKAFTEEDDIVVCPDCGAPYHRACYNESGECIFGELHESGSNWEPPIEKTEAQEESVNSNSAYEIKDKECPVCGVLNGHSATFCVHCGNRLDNPAESENADNANPFRSNPGVNGQPYSPYGFGGVPFAMDPMGGVSPTDPIDDGVSYGDVSKIVAINTQYYMPVFKAKQALGRGKFNFSAFLFSGGWFIYRKQYKPGIILSAIMFILLLANTLLSYTLTLPILNNYMTQLGYDINLASYSQYMEATNLLASQGNGSDMFLALLPSLISLVMFVIMIICGIKANGAYMNYCINNARELKKLPVGTEESNMELQKRRGTNTTAAFILMILYFICRYLPSFLL